MERREAGDELVFGLDIGTRNVVGTVGFKQDKEFIVLAQYSMEHETRAMLDGQIHDIGRVGNTIRIVKENLEQQIGQELTSVCIAAAGRVLKTVTTHIEYEFETESVVRAEDIHTLDLLGIERAQAELKEKNDTKYKFYCVGYSVVKYFLNDEIFSNLEGHKAEKISEDIIVTFLPEDVVDGLYSAVAIADLSVANMTLEPIAAIDVAIPENFRMLNIALVDVGAGTSDICITRDGSIIAYGMIPLAGDELTELIVQSYLVDFAMAEHIKLASTKEKEIEYTDIMTLKHTLKSEEVWKLTEGLVDRITTDVANKIKELNGDTTVSATFVVGGGGKIHGFTEMLADKLELPNERVALRGEEVLKEITFEQPDIQKDPLLVTPIGICLNYYEQRNSFIMVHFNGERIKLYDNGRLTIVDAAMQAGFPNEYLFPKRGKEINFTVNGSPRIARGEAGDSAIVKVNDKETNINAPLVANSYITVEPSTAGEAAVITIDDLAEYTQETVTFEVNGKTIHCPKFVEVNGSIEVSSYHVQEGDVIETRNFYTVEQLAEFMDVEINQDHVIRVNNRPAELNTLLYENFTVEWTASAKGAEDFAQEEPEVSSQEPEPAQETLPEPVRETEEPESIKAQEALEVPKEPEPQMSPFEWASQGGFFDEPPKQEDVSLTEETQMTQEANPQEETLHQDEPSPKQEEKPAEDVPKPGPGPLPKGAIQVEVNGNEILLTGKREYIFVDLFDAITFDLNASNGRAIVTTVNGEDASYMQKLNNGDVIEIYWEEK
ncbi:MAG: rod shape-determining protein [Lachnospiraceae bacterium]|nr:rod shape-determining protein [Lachnospiraceae bacterium]